MYKVLVDPDATNKLLDTILIQSGRKVLAKLARTSRSLSEPTLNKLWQDLDSFAPLIALFPTSLLRKLRKRPYGLVKIPEEKDWKRVLTYGERVRGISYDESANNISPSVFSVFAQHRPREFILPKLRQLTWKAETPAGLEGCYMFLNPGLEDFTLVVGSKVPSTSAFLAEMCSRTQLKSFSFMSPQNLPDDFTDLLQTQQALEKIALVAPGALGPGVGRWTALLPKLQTLQLDLTRRAMTAVEGFFDDIGHQSGASTPNSIGSTDSGVFSGDEFDFLEIRKSALRLTGDFRPKGAFAQLRHVHLTGEAGNIAVFLKRMTAPLTRIDLVLEDPVDKADWQDLSALLSERFGDSLQSLHITATGSSRLVELIRSTTRAEPPSQRLALDHFTLLPRLARLDIDLPVSVVFHDSDVSHLAKVCPNLEVVKLCPVARFQKHPPEITLEGISPLLSGCARLHTLAVVINADQKNQRALESHITPSRSLSRLHVGHSWVKNPLEVTTLLSRLAPRLKFLKWFNEASRPGVVEENRRGWEKVNELLPHFQKARMDERNRAISSFSQPLHVRAPKADKFIDATSMVVDRSIQASLLTRDCGMQHTPASASRMIQVKPTLFSSEVDARPIKIDVEIQVSPTKSHQSVDVRTELASARIEATPLTTSITSMGIFNERTRADAQRYIVSPLSFILSLAFRIFITYPLYIPFRLLDLWLSVLHTKRHASCSPTKLDTKDAESTTKPEKHSLPECDSPSSSHSSDSDLVVNPVRP